MLCFIFVQEQVVHKRHYKKMTHHLAAVDNEVSNQSECVVVRQKVSAEDGSEDVMTLHYSNETTSAGSKKT